MKKFLSVILAASMLLSLTACAGNESSTSDSSTSTESADSSNSSAAEPNHCGGRFHRGEHGFRAGADGGIRR